MLVVEILLFPRDAWLFNSPLTQAAGARHPACVCLAAWTLAPQSRVRRGTVKTCAERLQAGAICQHVLNILQILQDSCDGQ